MITLTLAGSSRSLDISTDAQIFKSTCTSWPGYQPGINDLAITHVRKYASLQPTSQDGINHSP